MKCFAGTFRQAQTQKLGGVKIYEWLWHLCGKCALVLFEGLVLLVEMSPKDENYLDTMHTRPIHSKIHPKNFEEEEQQ